MEFQTLLQRSGVPDFYLASVCADFQEQYGRFPYLDEIDGADSSEFLNSKLKIKNDYTTIEQIQNFTGKNNIQESQIWLNDNFRDKEIQLLPLTKESKVTIFDRPITKQIENPVEHFTVNDTLLIENIVGKLKQLYGLPIEFITSDNLKQFSIPGIETKDCFTLDGITYINSGSFSLNSPVYKLIPILISSLRNTDLYKKLVLDSQKYSEFKEYSEKYKYNPLEESFLYELTNLVSRGSDNLTFLPKNIQYELFYTIKRNLDSILMGESSVKDINDTTLFNSSLKSIIKKVNSSIDNLDYVGTKTDEILQDKSNELIEKGLVTEYCHV